jgi:hypothetical protein
MNHQVYWSASTAAFYINDHGFLPSDAKPVSPDLLQKFGAVPHGKKRIADSEGMPQIVDA